MNEEQNEEQNASSVNNDINVDNSSESKPSFSDSIKNIGGALKDSKGYRSRKRMFNDDETGSNNSNDNNNESIDIPKNSNAEINTNRINRNRNNIASKALNTAAKVNPIARGVKAVNDVGNTLNNIKAKRTPGRALGMGVSNNTSNNDNDTSVISSNDTNTDNNSDTNNTDTTSTSDDNKGSNTPKKNKILNPVPDLENINPLNNKINFWGLGSVKIKTLLAVGLPLVGILLILLVVLAVVSIPSNFSSLLGLDDFLSGGTAASEEEQEYYDNLKRLQEEYNGQGKTMVEASLQIVTAVFNILQTYDPTFGFEDMTYNRMKEVADLLFESISEEEGGGFRLLDDASTKNNLADYFSRLLPGQSSETYQEMANQVYEYIEAYEEITSEDDSSTGYASSICSSNSYWWPIGSIETTERNGVTFASGDPQPTVITATFGGNDSVHQGDHGALDISTGNALGNVNIIAAKDGTVVYPTDRSLIQFPDNGSLSNRDGGGYGNYVIIEHSDGNFTLYGHMAQNSITVMAGDKVKQGQVIGKMGHSGRSTGAHLHFEVRAGANSSANKVDPLDYVSQEDPRPQCTDFSLITTTLSKSEFVAKMNAYCEKTGREAFCTNFAAHAEEVYDVSLESGVNPELVVVTAGTEQGWTKCGSWYNFWGIGISNGEGCNSGPHLTSLAEGIREYASVLDTYKEGGSAAPLIIQRYEESEAAGCDPAGHGLPGTLAGMQSVYGYIGAYRYNPGSSGLGGCYILNQMYGPDYCDRVPSGDNVPTTVCEQNDYTIFTLQHKLQFRQDIFGL